MQTCRCYKPIDVVVGLDLGKLSTADFKLQRDFVERFVDQFSISSEYVNMGVFTVGASVKVGVEVKQGNIRSVCSLIFPFSLLLSHAALERYFRHSNPHV